MATICKKTEKRLAETRGLCARAAAGNRRRPLRPSNANVRSGVFARRRAHAQEATVLDRVLDDISERDLLIARSSLLHRQVSVGCCPGRGRLLPDSSAWPPEGGIARQTHLDWSNRNGRSLRTQAMVIRHGDRELVLRRITVCLDEPTRDGDTELHLLSNASRSEGQRLSVGPSVPAALGNRRCVLHGHYNDALRIEIELPSALRSVPVLHGDVGL